MVNCPFGKSKKVPKKQSTDQNFDISHDIHSALSEFFRAYAVFPPAPGLTDFDLFQFAIIKSNIARCKRPEKTVVNLRAILEYLQTAAARTCIDSVNHRECRDCAQVSSLLAAFLPEFEHVKSREPELQPDGTSKPPATRNVTEHSLLKAGLGASIPGLELSVGVEADSSSLRTIQISQVAESLYDGFRLKDIIWENGHFIFRILLEALEPHLGFAEKARSLLIMVTKRVSSVVSVCNTSSRNMTIGATVDATHSGLAPGMAGYQSRLENGEGYYDNEGVTALEFLLFPVEKTGPDSWCFYSGISVCDYEVQKENGAEDNAFYQAQRWMDGECETPVFARESMPLSREGNVARNDASSSSEYSYVSHTEVEQPRIEFFRRGPRKSRIDIDIRTMGKTFADAQFSLGKYYRDNSDDPAMRKYGQQLIVSASMRGSSDATGDMFWRAMWPSLPSHTKNSSVQGQLTPSGSFDGVHKSISTKNIGHDGRPMWRKSQSTPQSPMKSMEALPSLRQMQLSQTPSPDMSCASAHRISPNARPRRSSFEAFNFELPVPISRID